MLDHFPAVVASSGRPLRRTPLVLAPLVEYAIIFASHEPRELHHILERSHQPNFFPT